jgi:hypothetical protein
VQRSRRTDPYPFTWEIPLAIVVAFVLMLVLGVHIGRGIANLVAGGGWTWPDETQLFRSLPGVLAGDSAAGLTHPADHRGTGLAGATATHLWLALTELTLVIAATWAIVGGLRQWGPSRLHGMATRAEAEQLLGVSRLRKVRGVVRPDLHGKTLQRTRRQPTGGPAA